jgi:hypothetical protein
MFNMDFDAYGVCHAVFNFIGYANYAKRYSAAWRNRDAKAL